MLHPNSRFLVPDLSPSAHRELRGIKLRWIFVAESPHVNEIAPDDLKERRPLCGAAGKKWWSLLSEILEGKANDDVSLHRLLRSCARHGIVIMNAVQYPLDSKISKIAAMADPLRNVGFDKGPGENSYKKLKRSDAVKNALGNLAQRLNHQKIAKLPIYCLGNDAEWFVKQAGDLNTIERLQDKIPHPSAWWRKGGLFGRIAREKLTRIFT